MDRNTLFAFFLISLVLIFTPKYLELVSPKKTSEPTVAPDSLKNSFKDKIVLEKTNFSKPKKLSMSSFNSLYEEKTIEIENNLFSAIISSKDGGSFKSFSFKNYFTKDSQNVNIINQENWKNLTLEITDQEGILVDLSSPWKTDFSSYSGFIKNTTTLNFKKEIQKDVFITKSLTFYPNSYKITCEIDASQLPSNFLRENIKIGWVNGLNPSEENIEDDQIYFQAYSYLGGEQENLKVKEKKPQSLSFNGSVDWSAIRTKYFTAALIPKIPSLIKTTTISGVKRNKNETYSMFFSFNASTKTSFDLYLGPLEYNRIKNLGRNLESIMDFGWSFIRPISKGVLFTLTKMHQYIPNYGFILVVFSVLIKIIVFPLTKKSYQSTSAMQKIQPELLAIRDKYKNNPKKLNQAQMQLYKKRGVNPLGGCLPMLIQMPLLFALFIVFRTTIELRAEPFIWWIKDLSTPDAVFTLPFKIPIYGSHIAILPIFMVISMFIQQKMMSGGAMQQPQQKTMQYFMTVFFFLIFNSFPSGLNLYYTLFNVLTILQQKLIPPNTE